MISLVQETESELWIPIFRDYEISNFGRVVSKKYGDRRLLKSYKNNRGYHCYDFRINGRTIKRTIHRLVALVFVVNLDPLRTTVNHDFGNKDDNRSRSLSWMTPAENSQHGVYHGLIYSGSSHYAAQIDDIQAKVIRSLKGVLRSRDIASYFNVSRSIVYHIQKGNSWKHI